MRTTTSRRILTLAFAVSLTALLGMGGCLLAAAGAGAGAGYVAGRESADDD